MIFVYKQSAAPISPWSALRHGGVNNLAPKLSGRYLVLLNFDAIQRHGVWHYVFHFDARDSLVTSPLAQLVGNPSSYPDDMNWHRWMGGEYQVISGQVRQHILKTPQDVAHSSAVITNMRESAAAHQTINPELKYPTMGVPDDAIFEALTET
jgi:hypothetical protein